MKVNTTAIVLAAGQGKRMNSSVRKQYLLIEEKPVLWYALNAFQNSFVDRIIVVAGADDLEHVQKSIVEKYAFSKVVKIVAGGKERYHSVALGIRAADPCDYIFIHDGARPFVTQDMLDRLLRDVQAYQACVAGMPAKDTVKIADENGFADTTPDRSLVWQIQTPQVFSYELIRKAYEMLSEKEEELQREHVRITDDAMVVETLLHHPVKLTKGSYENLKITTPEDLILASAILRNNLL